MTNLTDLLRQRNDVLSEIYYQIKSFTSIDVPYVFGPYSRSTGYSKLRELISDGLVLRVFKLHDGIDKYYLVLTKNYTGQILYDNLVSLRSTLKRLEKEIDKL